MKPILILMGLCFFLGCSSDDDSGQIVESLCDNFSEVLADDDFNAIDTAGYGITNIVLDDDCLSVTIGDSGCDPNNWELNLLSTNSLLLSLPAQRPVKLEVINNEACLAAFETTKTFDLVPFQVEGENEIILNIEGWATPISYQY